MDSSQSPSDGGNGMPPISQTNDTAASMQNLKQINESIEKTLALIDQLTLTISNYDDAMQMPLLERINGLVAELDNMLKLAENCNIEVPMEVVNLIDDGENPDLFTRDVINNCIAKNQITKGKTDAFKNFRNDLIVELEKNFPAEVETFRESRAASVSAAPVSGSAASVSAAPTSVSAAPASVSAAPASASAANFRNDLFEELEKNIPAVVETFREGRAASASAVSAPAFAASAPAASAVSAPAFAASAPAASAVSAPAFAASAPAPASASAAENIDMIEEDPPLDREREVRSERKKKKPKYLEDYEEY